MCAHVYVYMCMYILEHLSFPAKLLDYLLRNNKSNINIYIYIYITCQTPDLHPHVPVCIYLLLFVLV